MPEKFNISREGYEDLEKKHEAEKREFINRAHEEAIADEEKIESFHKEIERIKKGEVKEKIETDLGEKVQEQIQKAKEIMGSLMLGPKEVEEVFGYLPKEIPEIQFSKEDLERAKELNQMLILRVDKTSDGKPMSMKAMNEIFVKKWKREKKGKIFATADSWRDCLGADYFTKEHPRLGWALVSEEVMPESLDKNYLEQIEVIIKTLKDKVFKDLELPEEYAEAIAEFESKKKRLAELIVSNWREASKQLVELKITQLTQQTIPEMIYDVAMYYDKNNKRLLADTYSWSASPSQDGHLVYLGYFGAKGVRGGRWIPDSRRGDLGVSLSRSI